mgnify:FL=1|tara:strand:- start:160 stop:567 length:408 start_codon:yes stop_codon:yes gene_type:complete
MNQAALLSPVFVLILWTFIIFLIMAYGRVKYTKNAQKDAAHTKDLKGLLPAWVERTSDNYNHLFEQPVAFYAVTICIALINNFDALMVQLAWAFVILRIIHSIVQLTFNLVLLRFCIFAAGWLVIASMAYSQLFV